MTGFTVDEVMVGYHRFVSASGKHPLHFSLSWGNQSLSAFLNPFSGQFLCSRARGIITVGGLADKARCEGLLQLKYFSDRSIRYELNFKDEQGRAYCFVGEKLNLWPWNLYRTHVICYGRIFDQITGALLSESTVRFPYRELLPFVRSFRLRRGPIFAEG